jgi:hypothetical protein
MELVAHQGGADGPTLHAPIHATCTATLRPLAGFQRGNQILALKKKKM